MEYYILKCAECGAILDEDDVSGLCYRCDDRKVKKTYISKKERSFKNTDNKKKSHRTKKRKTKPRKEAVKSND